MISDAENPVEWELLISELHEAREHLENLTKSMSERGTIDEGNYSVEIGHLYAHLNRAWNSRRLPHKIPEHEWAIYSAFPDDIDPVG